MEEVWRREVSTLLIGFGQKMARNQNHGRILVYTSTTPPTIPAPNNQLQLKSEQLQMKT